MNIPFQACSPPRRCFCCLVTAERSPFLLLSLRSWTWDLLQSLNNDFAVLLLNLCHWISKETKQSIRAFSSKNTLRDYPCSLRKDTFFSSVSSKELPSSPNTGNYKTVMPPICVLLSWKSDASMVVVLTNLPSGTTETASQQGGEQSRLWPQGLSSNPESPWPLGPSSLFPIPQGYCSD